MGIILPGLFLIFLVCLIAAWKKNADSMQMNNSSLDKAIYIDGTPTNIEKIGCFSRKAAIKNATNLMNKVSFLSTTFGYKCTFADVPGFNDVVCLKYEKDGNPKITVCQDRGFIEISIQIGDAEYGVPNVYHAYNHEKPIRAGIVNNEHYVEDFTCYIKFILDNINAIDKNVIEEMGYDGRIGQEVKEAF